MLAQEGSAASRLLCAVGARLALGAGALFIFLPFFALFYFAYFLLLYLQYIH